MVGTTGFEPATPASRMQCSTRLSHVPTLKSYSEKVCVSMGFFGNRLSVRGKPQDAILTTEREF